MWLELHLVTLVTFWTSTEESSEEQGLELGMLALFIALALC